jgi:hypothetical protein
VSDRQDSPGRSKMRDSIVLIVAIGTVVLAIIGFVNFDLFVTIWAKAMVIALLVAVFATVVATFARAIK